MCDFLMKRRNALHFSFLLYRMTYFLILAGHGVFVQRVPGGEWNMAKTKDSFVSP